MTCDYYNDLVEPCKKFDRACESKEGCWRVEELNNPTWKIPEESEKGTAPKYKRLLIQIMQNLE